MQKSITEIPSPPPDKLSPKAKHLRKIAKQKEKELKRLVTQKSSSYRNGALDELQKQYDRATLVKTKLKILARMKKHYK